jgi:polyferredoxin
MLTRNAPDREPQSATFFLDANLPAAYLAPPPSEPPELWMEIWRARSAEIAVLLTMLAALFGILLLQDRLVENLRLYQWTRIVFLGLTLAFLGLYAKAQLSVVQVITFIHALRGEFKWELFLLDPMIFILWGFVALAMLFWGRGVFCGWLCPFGALQELVNEAARRLGVRQWEPPWGLHERLGMIKYLVFLAIFAISLNSMDTAFRAAEAEPFKTVITLHFFRAAPFVLYAVAVLVAGLFVRRAFCRYLCPLGGALALPARMRIFEWLKRRPQCGRECRQCAVKCPVQAINPLGKISPNECIYCLNCQALYHDAKVCKGLAGREARRQGMEAMIASAKQKEAGHG